MGKEEVYNLLKATGKKMSNREIADKINCSLRTIQYNTSFLASEGMIKYVDLCHTRLYYVDGDKE